MNNLNDNNQNDVNDANQSQELTTETGGVDSMLFLALSAVCLGAGAVLFALSFFIKNIGVYFMFGSILSEFAALTFMNAQKRHGYKKWFIAIRIAAYVIIAATVAFVIAGLIVTHT